MDPEKKSKIIIIGAGLTGLLIAFRLKKIGYPVRVLEARDRVGGRIHTVFSDSGTPVEMGATWFHHEHEHLIHLLKELKIPYFKQFMEGEAYFQRASGVPVESFVMPDQPPSYRISGGTGHLVATLMSGLEKSDLVLNETVESIELLEDRVKVKGHKSYWGHSVILTLPPKLWEERIHFSPGLSETLVGTARKTQTWMEDSVKIALTYDKPFWREKKISGTLFSNIGPITEFYDHCNEDVSKFALCGFLHPDFKSLNKSNRKALILEQMSAVFGNEAASFLEYNEVNWDKEQYTSGSNSPYLFPHQNNGNPVYQHSQLNGRLLFAGTETSPHYGGYMEGAVYSANQLFAKILSAV